MVYLTLVASYQLRGFLPRIFSISIEMIFPENRDRLLLIKCAGVSVLFVKQRTSFEIVHLCLLCPTLCRAVFMLAVTLVWRVPWDDFYITSCVARHELCDSSATRVRYECTIVPVFTIILLIVLNSSSETQTHRGMLQWLLAP